MKLIDISQAEQQADFFAKLEENASGWAAWEVKLASVEDKTSVFLGWLLAASQPDAEGAILPETPSSFFVVVREENAGTVDAALASHADAGVIAMPVARDQVAQRLMKAAGRNAKGYAPSILRRHRSSRAKNVMLVVDDDLLICAALANVLKPFGECLVAQDTHVAIEHYLRRSPDCVFVDLHLESETGLDFMDLLLRHDPDAHIIMLTSDASASSAIAAKGHGAKSFIAKPLMPNRIEYELFRSPTFRRYG